MRHADDPTMTASATRHDHAGSGDSQHGRVAHVLLLDRKRQLLLRRIDAAGLPHGGQLTSSVVEPVDAGESYEAAATRGLRGMLGRRAPEPRYVERTWIDRNGGRTFLGVFVAMHDGDAPSDHVAIPMPDVLRAARADDRRLEGAFLRALRAVAGDGEMW